MTARHLTVTVKV